eukprot:TRINITY_DN25499_c0_g1_i1.p1 TRINITY_DN25499_c0_g1~~TRINITY_DN25499_c0_g1_i1.p1  ORF type:complete len:104 (-),score=2.19 TRINITY_DN25499_c0_g1_i1:81-392(-)
MFFRAQFLKTSFSERAVPQKGQVPCFSNQEKMLFFWKVCPHFVMQGSVIGSCEIGHRLDSKPPVMVALGIGSGSTNFSSPCTCLLYTSPSPRDLSTSRMPSSA